MILQNCEILASVFFLFVTKILSLAVERYRSSMFNTGAALTSIPETDEEEVNKWVSKKKHEVLKAKYKCLKKLFQLYDASVIGILPEVHEGDRRDENGRTRRKRSNRTKTDACAGTTEVSSGDVTEASVVSETDQGSTVATEVMRDRKPTQQSCTSTQFDTTTITNSKCDRYSLTENSKSNITVKEEKEPDMIRPPELMQRQLPYFIVNKKPKLTKFQCFIQRIFGIRPDRYYSSIVHTNGHIYAASDNYVPPHYEKRRRRGLRFRKLSKTKRIQSDSALRNVKSPMILTYVQSVQKNCLMDTTARQCPIVGCMMIFYGIINYNDHLNLCHFTERKFVCHYCHEGFERNYDKYLHENEHIGISKLNANIPNIPLGDNHNQKASITQTDAELTKADIPKDKLKKIVSFFDKIANPDQIISEIKKNRCSESNLQRLQSSNDDIETENTSSNSDSDKRTVSCANFHRKNPLPRDSENTSLFPYITAVTCHFCGERFECRRQLSLHVDLEHRVHDKFSKFHSCAGIMNPRRRVLTAEDGKIDFKSTDRRKKVSESLRRKSEENLIYEPSTSIVYYTSMESIDSKAPMGYKWEPGTKIIHV